MQEISWKHTKRVHHQCLSFGLAGHTLSRKTGDIFGLNMSGFLIHSGHLKVPSDKTEHQFCTNQKDDFRI
uniref:Uncharacterized protein n=1 Tax=Solanum tuberosum TaxID=4113 RepID=M1CI33_SOLTU